MTTNNEGPIATNDRAGFKNNSLTQDSNQPALEQNELASAALKYAEMGLPVFPLHNVRNGNCSCGEPDCDSPGKHPLTEHGFKDATTDAVQVGEWWERWPEANIGVPTGPTSGWLVVDIDPRNGGNEFITQIIAAHGPWAPTAEQSTGGGGRHLIFKHQPGVRCGLIAPGIDRKADGGYVVVAPSITAAPYIWEGVDGAKALLKLAEAPVWAIPSTKPAKGERGRIAAGERNTTLTSLAGSMRRRDMSESAIAAALLEENQQRCNPPLDEAEVRPIAKSVSKYPPDSEPEHSDRKSQATLLVALAASVNLFHTPDNIAYAEMKIAAHWEIRRIKDAEFRHWLAEKFYQEHGKAPSSNAVHDALGVLEGKALYQGPQHEVFTRIARVADVIYLDLCNPEWEVVEITVDGWRIVQEPNVRFRRPRGMQELPKPARGGDIKELWKYVNVRTKTGRITVVTWLLASLQPDGPFPVLVVQGEQGSAKSTAARNLRSLADPNRSPLRGQPRDERDLMIAAQNGWFVGFDNISSLPAWLSDALCRLATGGGFATRELYSDDQETLFDAKRPVILNGIDGVAVRGDLLDRALVVELPTIHPTKRRLERQLLAGFKEAQPRILGALLDAVVEALKAKPALTFPDLPRMADAACWAAAGVRAFGWKPASAIAAIKKTQAASNTVPLEASPVMPALRRILRRRKFEGTATELLQTLTNFAGEKKPRGWPSNPQVLSTMLRRLAPNLRMFGVEVTWHQESGAGSQKIIAIDDQDGYFSDAPDASDAD